eukprot:8980057-Pyramimonas_sp.AAC.1
MAQDGSERGPKMACKMAQDGLRVLKTASNIGQEAPRHNINSRVGCWLLLSRCLLRPRGLKGRGREAVDDDGGDIDDGDDEDGNDDDDEDEM